ncbi:endo-beta-protein [Diplodia corticola]|uniref:Endo-beta-protein n=1 Tax=Diplodia corticola TaxID=236234 RepID=A0A1J9SDV5_9PEZI|nr:endo-beta-protein [Diplodia corticola]OJD37765.1 endo-beta-protein [Diplodia corticola]
MVLEEATNSRSAPSDSFADNAYPSDADPYSTPDRGGQKYVYQINLDEYPRPPPIIGLLVGYPRARAATTVAETSKAAAHVLRRPLTEEEARALAYHVTKANSTAAYGASAGALLAMVRCYQTRQEFKFPFWKPSTVPGWNPDVLGPLKGQAARTAYHLLRIPPYWFIGAFTAAVLSQPYGNVVATVAMAQDERLKAVNEAIQRLSRNRSGLPSRQPPPSAPYPGPAPQSGGNDVYDDMSPTSGAYADSPVNSNSRTSSDPSQDAVPRWGQGQPVGQAHSDDDASPTGGLGPIDSGISSGGGSAWDRVRQQASSERGPSRGSSAPWAKPTQKGQGTGSTLGDSFTFSSSDEERELAKAEAQKDFDDRLEKERRGADFNEGSKRW